MIQFSGSKPPPEILREMAAQFNQEADEAEGVVRSPKKAGAPKQPLDVQARVLKDMLPEVRRRNPFKVGDLVQQVKAYANYHVPEPDVAVALVTEVFADRSEIASSTLNSEHGTDRLREDMVILTMTPKGWAEYTVASWRFKAYDGDVA